MQLFCALYWNVSKTPGEHVKSNITIGCDSNDKSLRPQQRYQSKKCPRTSNFFCAASLFQRKIHSVTPPLTKQIPRSVIQWYATKFLTVFHKFHYFTEWPHHPFEQCLCICRNASDLNECLTLTWSFECWRDSTMGLLVWPFKSAV